MSKDKDYPLVVSSNEDVAFVSFISLHDDRIEYYEKVHSYKLIIWSHSTFNEKVLLSSAHGWFLNKLEQSDQKIKLMGL